MKHVTFSYFCYAVLCLFWLGSCSSSTPPTVPIGVENQVEKLTIYNWDTYIDPDILTRFEKEFNVKIDYQIFDSSDESLEKIKHNPGKYDLVIAVDYMVTMMRRDNLLMPINKKNIPNLKNLDPLFISPEYDPDNRFCMPYQWGTTAIAYNRKATGRDITSWGDLFDPQFKGRVYFVESSRTALGGVLLYLGYSPNTTKAAEINQARDFLIQHKEQFYSIVGDNGQGLLANGTVDIAVEYMGDILQIAADNPDIRYVIPDEGAVFWADNLCIPAGSLHQELAEKFMNYILEPNVGAQLSNYIRYASPNQAAIPFINKADKENPIIYPPANVHHRLFYVVDVGPEVTKLYDEAWKAILVAHKEK